MKGPIVVATAEGLALWQTSQLRSTAPLAARIDTLAPDERQRLEEILPLLSHVLVPSE